MTARLCEALWLSECVTRVLKAVEVEPDNAHPKTRSYGRKHVWSIRTDCWSRGEPVIWPCSTWPSTSKRRGCEVVALKVEDVTPNRNAIDRAITLRMRLNRTRRPARRMTASERQLVLETHVNGKTCELRLGSLGPLLS